VTELSKYNLFFNTSGSTDGGFGATSTPFGPYTGGYRKSSCDNNAAQCSFGTSHRSQWNYNQHPVEGGGVFMLRLGDKITVNSWQNEGELVGKQISLLVSDPINYPGWFYDGFRATHIWGDVRPNNYGEAIDHRPGTPTRTGSRWFPDFITQQYEFGEVQANFIRDDLSATTQTSIYWENGEWKKTMTRLFGGSIGTYIPNDFYNE